MKTNKFMAIDENYISEHIENLKSLQARDGIDDLLEIPNKEFGYQNVNGCGLIDVTGCISYGASELEKTIYGDTDPHQLKDVIFEAIQDPEIDSLVINFDSPGGYTTHVLETAEFIFEARNHIPIIGMTTGMSCSASMWLQSACTASYASPTATIGSVAVYAVYHDLTEYHKKIGVEPIVIKAGTLKGANVEGTALSEAQKENIQNGVNTLYGLFASSMRKYRGDIDDEVLQGQSFLGIEGVENGLIDSTASLEQAILDAQALGKLFKK